MPPLILASTSPRRRDLLTEAGYTFRIEPALVEEEHAEDADPVALTRLNALLKAREVARRFPEDVVLGADTLVAIGGMVLGKPADMTEAMSMLSRLTGRTHEVITAVALIHGPREHTFEVVTQVTFRALDEAGIAHYLTLINPLDKAGSYAAQEHGEVIIEKVEGSWTNVVGLPMERLAKELAAWAEQG